MNRKINWSDVGVVFVILLSLYMAGWCFAVAANAQTGEWARSGGTSHKYYSGNITVDGEGNSYGCSFFPGGTDGNGFEQPGVPPSGYWFGDPILNITQGYTNGFLLGPSNRDKLVGIAVKAGDGFHAYYPPFGPGPYVTPFGKTISHIVFCYGKKEPPCEPDDPCWCEEHPEDCKPEPKCDLSKLDFQQSNFGFGFTTDVNAPDGAGCDNPDSFKGEPGDQVRFDVCLNGTSNNGVILSPSLPFGHSEVVTVGNSSDVVYGSVDVVVADPEFENCEVPYRYIWAGSVAANTVPDACEYPEPCWCQEHPEDPRCEPPKECVAYAGIRFNAVPGWVSAEDCYKGLSHADFEASIAGDVTVCWMGSGGPDGQNVFAKANGVTYNPLPAKGYAWIGGDFDLTGYISATGNDSTNECNSGDLLFFRIYREPPDVCLPFLPIGNTIP